MHQNKMGVLAIFLLSLIIVAFAWLSFWLSFRFLKPLESQGKVPKPQPKDEEEEELDEEEYDEYGETLCGACGDKYTSDEFWIGCDICEKWFHGRCVKITPARAQHIKQYKCPSCSNKKPRR